MSSRAPSESGAVPVSRPTGGWEVRPASHEDIAGAAAAVAELLIELGGTPPPAAEMQATARALVENPSAGALLLAKANGDIVGVLGASWQIAIHSPGRYGLIQDLWVHPSWREQAIGAALVQALFELAQEQRMARVEVGLPSPRFERVGATEAFYRNNGFTPVGLRMRRPCS